MTPTEQDKELRDRVVTAVAEANLMALQEKHPIDTVETLGPVASDMANQLVDQLITADRKRVALEAERAGHVHAAKALKHQAELLGGTPDYMLKQFDVHIERHKAQQEEV